MKHVGFFKKANLSIAILLYAFFSFILGACQSKDDDSIEERVKTFAHCYFNLRYGNAMTLCTDSSRKWIEYKASNITPADLEIINSQTDTAQCDIDEVEISDDGTEAMAHLTLHNALICDSIGKAGRIVPETKESVQLKKINGKWYISLRQPL